MSVTTPAAAALSHNDTIVSVKTPYGWWAYLTPEEYEAGRSAIRPDRKVYPVWKALRDAGVPVRHGGRIVASLCATAILSEKVLLK